MVCHSLETTSLRNLHGILAALMKITFTAFLACLLLLAPADHRNESPELKDTRMHIVLLAAMHPELTLQPTAQKLVDDIQTRDPNAWAAAKNPLRPLQDGWDARIRLTDDPKFLQREMDELSAHCEELRCTSDGDPLYWLHNKKNLLNVTFVTGYALLIFILLMVWLIPIYIARRRKHPNFMPISVITILLGWTFIGWAVCLAWSLSSINKSRELMPEVGD